MSDQGAGGTAGETESAYSEASDACNCTDDEGAPPGGRGRGLSVEISGLSVGSLPSCPSSPGVYHLTAVVGGSPSVSPLAGARHPGRAATAPALLRQHRSWLKRAESKTQSLRRIFDLPADEVRGGAGECWKGRCLDGTSHRGAAVLVRGPLTLD